MGMFSEMREYWDNDEFWDQVMVGYTNYTKEEVMDHYAGLDLHQSACEAMESLLTEGDTSQKV